MYVRQARGQTLTLSVSGKLWASSLVMLDKETESLWSHMLGKAMDGPLVGEVLESLPSLMTDWKTWKTKHPETTVLMLERTAPNYRREMYGLSGKFMIGLALDDQARAWGFEQLHEHPVINDKLSETNLLVLFDRESSTATLFDRTLDGNVLTFDELDGKLVDRETGSVWDPLHGRSTEGTHKGKQLTPIPGIVSFVDAWSRFHPQSKSWSPDDDRGH